MPRLLVSLVTHNESRDAERLLPSLEEQSFRDFAVSAVDNDSQDGTRAALLSFQRRGRLALDVTLSKANLGYTGGHNVSIAKAAAAGIPWVLVLNADVVLAPGFLGTLLGEASLPRHAGAASFTGKVLRASGDELAPTRVVDSVGIWMTRNGRHFDIGAGEEDRGQYDRPAEVFGVSGCAALYRTAALEDVKGPTGYFDEDFFVYREDVELAWRLRGRGWGARCVPAAVAWHRRRNLPERRRQMSVAANLHSVKNRFLLRVNNAGRRHLVATFPGTFVRDLLVVGAAATVERTSWPALKWLAAERHRLLDKRRALLARRTVSDAELLGWFVKSPAAGRREDPA